MARKRRMGAMSTTETILVVGGVALVGYMLLKKKSQSQVPTTVYIPVNSGSNTTGQLIQTGGSVLTSLFDNLFGGG